MTVLELNSRDFKEVRDESIKIITTEAVAQTRTVLTIFTSVTTRQWEEVAVVDYDTKYYVFGV